MVLSVTQQLPIARTFFPIAFGLALGGAIYVLVDAPPRELRRPGGCAFRGCLPNLLLYHRRAQAVGKAAALGLLFMVTGVANQQSYNFLSVANLAVVFPLVFAVLAVATHFPVSFRAEHVFLRLLGRFFRAYAYLASTLPWEPANPPTRWQSRRPGKGPGQARHLGKCAARGGPRSIHGRAGAGRSSTTCKPLPTACRTSLRPAPRRNRKCLRANCFPRCAHGELDCSPPSQSRTALHDAAVSEDRGGRQVARAIAREERHDARNLLRAGHAAQRNGRVRVSSAAPDRSWWTD